jgi:hypothetical protein
MAACHFGRLSRVSLLLSNGAPLEHRDAFGGTAMAAAWPCDAPSTGVGSPGLCTHDVFLFAHEGPPIGFRCGCPPVPHAPPPAATGRNLNWSGLRCMM